MSPARWTSGGARTPRRGAPPLLPAEKPRITIGGQLAELVRCGFDGWRRRRRRRRRLEAGHVVDLLAQDVGVPSVPPGLLDHVRHDPAQIRCWIRPRMFVPDATPGARSRASVSPSDVRTTAFRILFRKNSRTSGSEPSTAPDPTSRHRSRSNRNLCS